MGHDPSVSQHSPPATKVSLFRSLFRGREDVYPRRFESRKTGKSGYSPACANEWVRGLCDKRAVKCLDCPARRFLPVTEDVIRQHLSGRDDAGREFVMGVYRQLVSAGGDTDTVASMAGQIRGVRLGLGSLPNRLVKRLTERARVSDAFKDSRRMGEATSLSCRLAPSCQS